MGDYYRQYIRWWSKHFISEDTSDHNGEHMRLMIQLGKVKGNKMIEMQLSNKKLWHRATGILTQELGVSREVAEELVCLICYA